MNVLAMHAVIATVTNGVKLTPWHRFRNDPPHVRCALSKNGSAACWERRDLWVFRYYIVRALTLHLYTGTSR
jgi:hypothetical protein